MYVRNLKIRNLRCFEEAELNLQYPGRESNDAPRLPNINLLLGNNGAGKTTVLKAIALATLSPVMPQSGFVPYHLVRRTNTIADQPQKAEAEIKAELLLHAQDKLRNRPNESESKLMTINVKRKRDTELLYSAHFSIYQQDDGWWGNMFDNKSPAFLVVGYGASRRVEDSDKFDESARRKSRLLRYERVAGLFESQVTLTPLGIWLPSFKIENPGRYKQVVNLIKHLLPDGAGFSGEFEKGEYMFEINGAKVPFGALSDGYRAYIGWIADLLYHICMGAPSGAKLAENRGIVLVDEIDLHLHPEWQRSVISTISQSLPNLQFVFTSHSPIVAGSLNKENIFVMETDSRGASTVRQYEERIYGLNAEQVLLSSYFNLKTTRAEPFVDELQELSRKAGKGDLKSALAFMERLAGNSAASNGKTSGVDENKTLRAKSATVAKKPVTKAASKSGKKAVVKRTKKR